MLFGSSKTTNREPYPMHHNTYPGDQWMKPVLDK